MLPLSPEEMSVLLNLMNSVQGIENARVLLPIYDKIKAAMAEAERTAKAEPA